MSTVRDESFTPLSRCATFFAWRKILRSAALFFSLTPLCLGQTYTISTFAGPASLGDNGPALDAVLNGPTGVVVDNTGNIYVADKFNHRVRRISPTGTIATIAGSNAAGFSGDGGPAAAARLNLPAGIASDSAGNLYIADLGNHRIRKVNSSGTITTFAGTGTAGFSGDGGPAIEAQLQLPGGVAAGTAGNVYIADTINHRVRKVSPSGTITTIVGTGIFDFGGDGGQATSAHLNGPRGVKLDGAGNLYIADTGNHRVRMIDAAGMITTFAGDGIGDFGGDGGQATDAQLKGPADLAIDGVGNVYIADATNNRIRKVDSSGMISTFAGNGMTGFVGDGVAATAAPLPQPGGVAIDPAGRVLITNPNSNQIHRVDTSGIISTIAGASSFGFGGDGGPARAARLSIPSGVEVDTAGNVYIADWANSRVRKVDPSGTITTFAGNGSFGFAGDGGPATAGELFAPFGVVIDGVGRVYIAEIFANRVRVVDPGGTMSTFAGSVTRGYGGDDGPATAARLNRPRGISVDKAGNVYVADRENNRIRKIDSLGTITTFAGSGNPGFRNFSGDDGLANQARLGLPEGVATYAGNVYIADTRNHRVRKVSPSGIIATVAGTGSVDGLGGFSGDGGPANVAHLSFPSGVALDTMGDVYIADTSNNRIRKIDQAGIITTIAGGESLGFGGDGGPATEAQLLSPTGLAVDSTGKIYIADRDNHRIRVLTPYVPPPPEPPQPPTPAARLNIQPFQLTFELAQDAAAASQGITLAAENGNVSFRVQPGGSWVSANPDRGIIAAGAATTIQAIVNPAGLPVGTHRSRLFVRGGVTSTQVEITLVVSKPSSPPPPSPVMPSVSKNGVVSAASLAPAGRPGHAAVPGSLVSIFGHNFTGGGQFEATTLPLPTTLGGVSVKFNGVPARLFAVWPNQINAQFPAGVSTAALTESGASQTANPTATVVVETTAGASDPRTVQIATSGPGIFTASAQGIGQAIVVFSNTATLAAPEGFSSNSRPAAAGDLLTIYSTGLGQVAPPIEDGANSCDPDSRCRPDYSNLVLRRAIEIPRITIGGVQVPQGKVLFSGLAPEFVAVNIVIIELPQGIGAGDAVPISIEVGGNPSPPGVTIAVE